MVWSGCWLCFFMSYLGWFCKVSAWLNWIALSRIPFPECFLLEGIFGQDLDGRNEATAISVRECLGYPTLEFHALSLVLKLCQGGWAQPELPALVTCLRTLKPSAWGEHGLPLQDPSPFWWIFLEPLLCFSSENRQSIQSPQRCSHNADLILRLEDSWKSGSLFLRHFFFFFFF